MNVTRVMYEGASGNQRVLWFRGERTWVADDVRDGIATFSGYEAHLITDRRGEFIRPGEQWVYLSLSLHNVVLDIQETDLPEWEEQEEQEDVEMVCAHCYTPNPARNYPSYGGGDTPPGPECLHCGNPFSVLPRVREEQA